MKRLKTIVVEDERLPLLALLQKLEDHSVQLEVVDDCDNYQSALESILRHRPDLLPYVIFTTAYSDREYLMSAIKLSAVDYLLKPIGKAELAHAIAKAVDRARIANLPEPTEKMSFKSVNSKLFLMVDDIAGFKAEGNYATLISFEGNHLVLENLLSLEGRLQGKGRFVRVDRCTIINIEKVRSINQRQHSCTLMSQDSRTVEIPLSNSGMNTLSAVLETF